MSRMESAAKAKGDKRFKNKIPREGTKLRELWDLLHVYRGVVLTDALHVRFPKGALYQLRDFYGLDIRLISGGSGRPGNWVLAGEWMGSKYIDYIANRQLEQMARV